MKANLPVREPALLQKWQTLQLYKRSREQTHTQPKYILHDGPPYANGQLHLGHGVNKILKDIILKSKTLSGFDAPFIPGWDCHGLPIELNVEKTLKAKAQTYTPQAFREACRRYALEQVDIQRAGFQRLGVLADWDHPYLTMDFSFEAQIIRTLSQCITAGYVQPGFKPVHWCIDCSSALAELEVEYQDKTSIAVDVRFRVVGNPDLPGHGPLSIPVWTTTAWTLPANEAVALGPEIDYCLIQTPNERLILAAPLLATCLARYHITHYELLAHYRVQQLRYLQLQHPFEAREVPIVESDHVTTDAGTGAVHIAPTHGHEDYQLGQREQLPLRLRVNTQGCYQTESLTALDGQSVLTAYPHIIALLNAQQTLLCEQPIQHSYPHCWRHKTPLIFLATPQWFLQLQQADFRKQLEQAIHTVNWIPDWGQNRMRKMVGEDAASARPDWCLSRQRHWGVPLPLFVHRLTGQWHPQTIPWLARIAEQVEQMGIEAWYRLEPGAWLGDEAKDYQKLTDTLDVWFDSGVTHYAVLKHHPKLAWPADLYLEGTDQFRGWFQSSLLTAVALDGQAPYRNVLTHGFTVDEQGRKMSKSLGNVISLESVIQKWGADILRLWIASADTRTEISVSQEILQRIAEAYRRIRNTLRFLLGNLHDFDPEKDQLAPEQLLSIDRWMLVRAAALQETLQAAYDSFNFHHVYQAIYHFCIHELSSFYLAVLKDRLYTMQPTSLGRRSGQTALYHITQAMLRWLAPILSFTAEEAWSHLPGMQAESIFLTQWHPLSCEVDTDPLSHLYQEAGGCEACWHQVLQVRDAVNKAIEITRDAGKIGSGLEAVVTVRCHSNTLLARLLTQLAPELHFIFLTAEVRVAIDCLQNSMPLSNAERTEEPPFSVHIKPVDQAATKCDRCWHRRHDVGQNTQHPSLCLRCIHNLPDGVGELRYYA